MRLVAVSWTLQMTNVINLAITMDAIMIIINALQDQLYVQMENIKMDRIALIARVIVILAQVPPIVYPAKNL